MSQRAVLGVSMIAGLLSAPASLQAAPAEQAPAASREQTQVTWFRATLGAGYALPLGAAALAYSLSGTPRRVLAVSSLALGLGLPALARYAHAATDGIPMGLIGAVGGMGAGLIVGGLIGLAQCHDLASCELLPGAGVGMVGGYALWGVVDSVFFAHTSPRAATPGSSGVALWPYATPILAETGDDAPLQGLTLGLVLRL
jgi:hypothetical protein